MVEELLGKYDAKILDGDLKLRADNRITTDKIIVLTERGRHANKRIYLNAGETVGLGVKSVKKGIDLLNRGDTGFTKILSDSGGNKYTVRFENSSRKT